MQLWVSESVILTFVFKVKLMDLGYFDVSMRVINDKQQWQLFDSPYPPPTPVATIIILIILCTAVLLSVMLTHVSVPPPVTSQVIILTMTDNHHICMTPSPWCTCTVVPLTMECGNELNTKFPNPFIVLNNSVFVIWCFRPMLDGLVNLDILIFRALNIRRTHLLIVSAADAKQTYCYLRTLRQIIKTHATSCVDIQRTDLASSRQILCNAKNVSHVNAQPFPARDV